MAEQQNSAGIGSSIRNANEGTLTRLMRLTNFLCAGLMIACGIVSIILGPSFAEALLAIYLVIFGLIVLAFDFRLKRFDLMFYRLFGFMFSAFGRAMFQLFIGTLAFALGIFGIITGIVCVLNVIFVFVVLRLHPTLANTMDAENAKRQGVAAGAAALQGGAAAAQNAAAGASAAASGAASKAKASASSAAAAAGAAAGGAAAGGGTSAAGWEKLYDNDTGRYYYFNAATAETRWDDPAGQV